MSYTAVGQSRQPETSLGTSEASTRRESDLSQGAPERVSDIALANAAAHAARMAPGVVDLSPGRATPVATYGPGQRVVGIIIHHPAPEQIVVEVHVALSESTCMMAPTDAANAVEAAPDTATEAAEPRSPILEIASHIRSEAREAVRRVAPLLLAQVDVYVDDLR